AVTVSDAPEGAVSTVSARELFQTGIAPVPSGSPTSAYPARKSSRRAGRRDTASATDDRRRGMCESATIERHIAPFQRSGAADRLGYRASRCPARKSPRSAEPKSSDHLTHVDRGGESRSVTKGHPPHRHETITGGDHQHSPPSSTTSTQVDLAARALTHHA